MLKKNKIRCNSRPFQAVIVKKIEKTMVTKHLHIEYIDNVKTVFKISGMPINAN